MADVIHASIAARSPASLHASMARVSMKTGFLVPAVERLNDQACAARREGVAYSATGSGDDIEVSHRISGSSPRGDIRFDPEHVRTSGGTA